VMSKGVESATADHGDREVRCPICWGASILIAGPRGLAVHRCTSCLAEFSVFDPGVDAGVDAGRK
jgi:hypothetical protein